MSWKDRLIMKLMGNKIIIKIFSIPIVLKIMMWATKVVFSFMSLFRGKKVMD